MKPEDKLSQSVQRLVNTNEVTIVQAMGELRKSGKEQECQCLLKP